MADGGVWTKIYPDVASLGGGKVLQVVQKTESSSLTNSTNGYQTHNSLSITPTAVGNVLIVQAASVFYSATGAPNFDYKIYSELMQDGATVPDSLVQMGNYGGNGVVPQGAYPQMAKITASSTSTTTFSIQFKPGNSSSAATMQRSHLLIMEVAQ